MLLNVTESASGGAFRSKLGAEQLGMANSQISGGERRGLAKKPYSAALGIVVIVSTGISVLAGGLLAYDFLGYHAPGHQPHPEISILLLALGMFIAAAGQLLGAGRNEGIRVRGWVGVIDVLHLRLVFSALTFLSIVVKFAMRGKQIHLYPVGIIAMACGLLLVSRFMAKYVFQIDRRRRVRG